MTNTALQEVKNDRFIVKNPEGEIEEIPFDYGFICLGKMCIRDSSFTMNCFNILHTLFLAVSVFDNGFLYNRGNIAPVSYTHLDVYKRQHFPSLYYRPVFLFEPTKRACCHEQAPLRTF